MKPMMMTGLALAAGLSLAGVAHAEDAPAPQATAAATAAEAPAEAPVPITAPTTVAPVDAAAAGLREHYRHHGGGIVRFVTMSLDTLGADEAKRAEVAKLQSELQASLESAREAEKELLETLADGVQAGRLDKEKMDAVVAKQATAATARREAGYETLNKLHALLSPVERASLADKVTAHWEVWRQVNHPTTAADEQKGRLDELAQEVALVPDQVEKIAAALKANADTADPGFDPKRGEARLQAFTKTFVTAKFEGKAISSQAPVIAGRGSARMVRFYEAAAPVMTRVQRMRAAYDLRQDANHEPASASPETK